MLETGLTLGDTQQVLRPAVPIDLGEARAALEATSRAVSELVAPAPDPSAPVPGLQWTVGETAAHMATMAIALTDPSMRGRVTWVGAAEGAAFNAELLRRYPERRPEALARALVDAPAAFLDQTKDASADDPLPWYSGATLTVAVAAAHLTGEFCVHGLDIARALGRPWTIDPAYARLEIYAQTAFFPITVVRDRSARLTYETRVRGGERFVVRVADGRAEAVPPGERVDFFVSADPVAYLLVALGRQNRWTAGLRGKIVAGGRKPWRAFRLQSLFEVP